VVGHLDPVRVRMAEDIKRVMTSGVVE